MVDVHLTVMDHHNLRWIAQVWVSASYWEDETIRRYRQLGLVSNNGARLRLTEAGQRASMATSVGSRPVSPSAAAYHPI
jgi:hypothetical protein